jgi:hypothetical protein
MTIIRIDRVERSLMLLLNTFIGLFLLACFLWGALSPEPVELEIKSPNSSRCALEGSQTDYQNCMTR